MEGQIFSETPASAFAPKQEEKSIASTPLLDRSYGWFCLAFIFF